MRRWRTLLAVLLLMVVPAPVGRAGVPVVVVEGRGWGHGVGMPQDGAYWMGRAGADTGRILAQFYPDTRPASAGGPVRVAVATSPSGTALLAFPAGGEVRDAPSGPQSPGFPVPVAPGGQVLVRFDGSRYSIHPGPGDGSPGPPLNLGTTQVTQSGESPVRVGPVDVAAAPAETTVPSLTTTTTTGPTTNPEPTSPSSTTTTSAPDAAESPPPARSEEPPVPPEEPAPEEPPPGSPPAAPPPPAGSPPPAGAPAPDAPSSDRPLRAVPKPGATVVVPAVDRRYRGQVEATGVPGTPAALRLLNDIDVEDYLRGMGEVLDPAWPPAALQAQAIAARTYALRAMAASGEICAEQRCQVYLGQQAEYPAMDRAVARTAGQVLTFDGALASTVYSANGGGMSASPEEGFGPAVAGWQGAFPYLRAAPYPTDDPAPWSVTIGLDDVAARLRYPGPLSSVAVTESGTSGRARAVALDGGAGPRTVTGTEFTSALGLRSTLFQIRLDVAADAAAPPPAAPLQASPDTGTPPAAGSRPATPAEEPASGPVGADAGSRRTEGRTRPVPLGQSLVVALVTLCLASWSRRRRHVA